MLAIPDQKFVALPRLAIPTKVGTHFGHGYQPPPAWTSGYI